MTENCQLSVILSIDVVILPQCGMLKLLNFENGAYFQDLKAGDADLNPIERPICVPEQIRYD